MTTFNEKLALKKQEQTLKAEQKATQLADDKRTAALLQALTLSFAEITKELKAIKGQKPELVQLPESIGKVLKDFTKTVKAYHDLTQKRLPDELVVSDGSKDVVNAVEQLRSDLSDKEFNPEIIVQTPQVTVEAPVVDLSGLEAIIKRLESKDTTLDASSVEEAVYGVEKAVRDLIARPIPVPETPLPFKDSTHKGTQALVDADGHAQVDVLTMPAVTIDTTGLATSTKQDTLIGHVDGVEALLGTIDTDTGNIASHQTDGTQKTQIVDAGGEAVTVTGGKLDVNASVDTTGLATSANQTSAISALNDIITATESVANAVAGSEMQVDVVGSLPAGTNNIGDVDIFSNTVKDGSGARYQPLVDTDGHLQIDVLSMPAGGSGLTDAELRATPVPISGTVAVTNAGLTELAAAVNASSQVDVNIAAGNITGFATSAKQDTIIGHLDGVETTLTAIDGRVDGLETSNSAIQTAVELLDDTVTTLGTTTYTEATSKGITIGAVRRDADTTLVNTTNEFGPLQMDANGRLKVEVFSGETLPVSGTVSITANSAVNVAQMNGTTVTMGNGAAGTGVQRVTLASDSTGQVAVAANATATGTAINCQTALTNTKIAVKASAGNLYGYHIYNPGTSVAYVQIFNVLSASVTLGTTAPTMVLAIPPGGWADSPTTAPGIAFSTAITLAATTTATGSTAPATNLVSNVWYL